MAFVYARSDDVGAPTLTGEIGSMIALLKACLVDGYGAKAAAGWSVPFEDAPGNVAVFRPGAGNRFYYRVDDNGGSVRGARVATIEGFKSMIGHASTDGTADFCGPTYKGYLPKSKDLNATAAAWVLFADDKKCWFFAGSSYFTAPGTSALDENFDSMYTFFGDYNSLGPDNNSSALLCGHDDSSSFPYGRGFNNYNNTYIHNSPGDCDGVVQPTKLVGIAESFLATETYGVSWSGGVKGLLSPQKLTSDLHVCRLMIADGKNSSSIQLHRENLRGVMPGALIICTKINPTLFEPYTINGKNYIHVGLYKTWSGSKNAATFLMNTDGTDF